VLVNLKRRYEETESEFVKEEIHRRFMRETVCPQCKGLRLKPEGLNVLTGGRNIAQLTELPIAEIKRFMAALPLSEKERAIARLILKEINSRLNFLDNVGLGYISLERRSETLSGGEAQRIQLATQIGSGLTGVLYVLDEPTIGLHQRDNARLIGTLKTLRDIGNTLIVVEHDEAVIRSADHVVDMGRARHTRRAGGGKRNPRSHCSEPGLGNRRVFRRSPKRCAERRKKTSQGAALSKIQRSFAIQSKEYRRFRAARTFYVHLRRFRLRKIHPAA